MVKMTFLCKSFPSSSVLKFFRGTKKTLFLTVFSYALTSAPFVSANTLNPWNVQSTLASGLNGPSGVAVDSSGNVYIADAGNNRILMEILSGGTYTQSTLPTSVLNAPTGVAVDSSGNVYIADSYNSRILMETLSGGTYTESTLPTSVLNHPYGVAVDSSNNVYIADTSHSKILIGTMSGGTYTQSNTITSALLTSPYGVAVDSSGNLFIAVPSNNKVLNATLSGGTYTVTSFVGSLGQPCGVAVDSSGNVYIADTVNNRILMETLSGGTYTQSTLVSVSSGLSGPFGVAVDNSPGNLYFSDYNNNRAVKLNIEQINITANTGSGGTVTLQDNSTYTVLEGVANSEINLSTYSLTANISGASTFNGNIIGAGSLTVGGGLLALTGTNTYTGGTMISSGTLSISATNNLGSSAAAVTFNGAGSPTLQVTSPLTLANPVTLTTDGAIDTQADVTASGNFTGTGVLTKAGANTLIFAGTNTSGGTKINAGTVKFSTAAHLGSTVTFNGGTLQLNASASSPVTLNNVSAAAAGTIDNPSGQNLTAISPSGGGALTKIGSGLVTFSGSSSRTGGMTVNAGALAVDHSQALGSGGLTLGLGTALQLAGNVGTTLAPMPNAISLSGNSTIDNKGYTGYLAGPITGAGTLTIQGNGKMVMGGANNAPTSTTIASGTLALLDSNTSFTTPITVNSGASYDISNGAANPTLAGITASAGSNIKLGGQAVTLSSGTVPGNLLDGGLSGATGASVTKTGLGTLALSGVNTYSGGTMISSGTLSISATNNLGSSAAAVTFNGAGSPTLQVTSPLTLANPVTLTTDGAIDTQADVTASGNFTGTGVLTKAGANTLIFAGTNTSGGTKINAGTVKFSTAAHLGSTVTFNGGTLQLNASASSPVTLNNVSAAAAGTIDNPSGQNLTAISPSGGGALTKIGSGLVTFSGSSSRTGGMTVNAGALAVDHSQALGSGGLTLGLGTALQLAGNVGTTLAPMPNAISLSGNSTIDNKGYTGYLAGPITGAGTLTIQGNGKMVMGGANNAPTSTTIASGTLALLDSNTSFTTPITVNSGASYDISNGAANPTLAGITASAGSNIKLGGQAVTLSSGTVPGNLLDGGLSGATGASVTKTGLGTLALSGVNTYSGGTMISSGTLSISATNNLGSSAAAVTFNGAGSPTLQVTSPLTLANPVTLTTDGAIDTQADVTASGNFTGTGVLTKAGANTLIFAGTNTSGGTKINAGTVKFSTAAHLGSTVTFNGGTLQLNASASSPVTLNNVSAAAAGTIDNPSGQNLTAISPSGGGALTKIGSGLVTFSGSSSRTGGMTVNAGALAVDHSQALGSGGLTLGLGTALQLAGNVGTTLAPMPNAISLSGNSTIDNKGYTGYLAGPITGAGTLTVQGNGKMVMGGANNAPTSTTIASGTLALLDSNTSFTTPITVNSGASYDISNGPANPTLTNITTTGGSNIYLGNQTLNLSSGTVPGNLLDGGLSGATGASVTKTGLGTLALSGTNTYLGGTNLQAGTINITNRFSLGTGPFDFAIAGATFQIGTDLGGPIPNAIILTADGNLDTQGYNVTLGGSISGTATLHKLGSGILTLSGANSYNGAMLLDGKVALGNNQGFGGGTLSFNTAGTVLQIAAPLSDVANPVSLVSDGIIDTAGNGANFSGSFSGVGGIIKNGTGILQLSNVNNPYSGATSVNAGELKVNGSLPNSAVTVANGAKLTGNATVYSLTNLGTVKPGNSIGISHVLTDFNNTGGTYNCEINDVGLGESDLIQVDGIATLHGTLNVLPQAGNYSSPKTYTILTAPNKDITTTFDAVTSPSILLKYTLNYLPRMVRLTAIQGSSVGSIVNTEIKMIQI